MSWFELYGDDYFESLFMGDLGRDESYLRTINNGRQIPVYLLQVHKECVECDYYKSGVIYSDEVWKVKSSYKYRVSKHEIYNPNGIICDQIGEMGEFGVYNLTFNDTSCIFETNKEPVNVYLPILSVLLICLLPILMFFGMRRIFNARKMRNSSDVTESPQGPNNRIKALDTFRGISIVIMIFVNLGAGGYDILDHTPWNGLHLADFVFPWFLWIMGVCIPISLLSSSKKNITNSMMFSNVQIRSIKLFCIGVFLNSGICFDKFRIMGVLQRFAISYFVVATICIYLLKMDILLNRENIKHNTLSSIRVTAVAWNPIIFMAVLHLLIIFLVADTNCEKGYLGPGGLHKHSKYEGCTGGATGFLDRAIFSNSHVYQTPTIIDVYKSQPFDPEGLVGCLNSIVHTFIGVQAGVVLLLYKDHKLRIIHLLSLAAITGILGAGLCGFSIENGWIPLNKNLWSLSFVLVTSSSAFLLLTLCYFLIDVKEWWQGKPFFYAGMNSIFIYVGHQITSGFFPFSWKVSDGSTQTHFLLFFEDVTGTLLWILISYYLYKKKFFLTV